MLDGTIAARNNDAICFATMFELQTFIAKSQHSSQKMLLYKYILSFTSYNDDQNNAIEHYRNIIKQKSEKKLFFLYMMNTCVYIKYIKHIYVCYTYDIISKSISYCHKVPNLLRKLQNKCSSILEYFR